MGNLNNLTNLQKIAKVWQLQLNLEYCNKINNTRLSFKDIGAFCELLATQYNYDFVGCGSGGMGLDLINYKTKKAVEVKSCCTIQNAVCQQIIKDSNGKKRICGTKFNDLFMDKCPRCGSKNYKRISDSRFGIDAKEFLNQYNQGFFQNFTMCYISLKNQDKDNKTITVKLEWFIVDFFDNEIKAIQLQYFTNQSSLGKKAHCNLLPYSYDFYKLCPKKIDDKEITVSYADLNINPVVKSCQFDKKLRIPLDLIPKRNRELFMSLKSYIEDHDSKTADCKDFTMNIPYKSKSLGKERGDTRKKVYSALK